MVVGGGEAFSCTNKALNDLYCQQSSGLGLILSSQQCF